MDEKPIAEVLVERGKTHGNWEKQANLSQSMKACFDLAQQPIRTLSKAQRDAVDMIIVKLSRIGVGNPNEPDHWLDIQGYAKLGEKSEGLK
jgi:hypothetical protein